MIEYENLGLLNRPFFEEFKQAFNDVLQSGWYILGEQVASFEEEFSGYLNGTTGSCCIGVASGLDALQLSLQCNNFPSDGEVIVAANSYFASVLSILNAGLVPVLVDPDPKTYNLSIEGIESAMTSRTVAIMPVHMYGKPCPMPEIIQLADKQGLIVVEDCAQAHGASIDGRKVGTFGNFGAFSFYPTKNLGALGDGGAVYSRDPAAGLKLRALRNYGSREKYKNELVGVNSRLDEVQAAFLRVKLKHLDAINQHKQSLAAIYDENLKGELIKPKKERGLVDVHHIYPVRHPFRDKLRQHLLKMGIQTEIHYPVPPHKQRAFFEVFKGCSYPISEEIHDTILSLPVSLIHSRDAVMEVVESIDSMKN